MKNYYHAVMIDETGCEFGVDVVANTREAAYEKLRNDYPESCCDQLESPEDTIERERVMMDHIARGGDWDDDGRLIFPPVYDYDDGCDGDEVDLA